MMKLNVLAHCIERDPRSFQGLEMLYLRGDSESPEFLQALGQCCADDAVILCGDGLQAVVLGDITLNEALGETLTAYVSFEDVGRQWHSVVGVLRAMQHADANIPTMNETLPSIDSLSILVVEDDPMTSRMIGHHLAQYGTVVVSGNYREAVANYMVHRPDIIFLDIHYRDDDSDGFDVMRNLFSVDAQVFVVMFSGDKNPATMLKCFECGAQGFIAKPFEAADFAYYFNKFSSAVRSAPATFLQKVLAHAVD